MKKANALLLFFVILASALCVLCACDKDDACEHSFGEWQVTQQATCTQDGEEERKCSLCGYVVSKAPGHEYGETGCVRCNVSFAGYLTYELTDDGAGYRISRLLFRRVFAA